MRAGLTGGMSGSMFVLWGLRKRRSVKVRFREIGKSVNHSFFLAGDSWYYRCQHGL